MIWIIRTGTSFMNFIFDIPNKCHYTWHVMGREEKQWVLGMFELSSVMLSTTHPSQLICGYWREWRVRINIHPHISVRLLTECKSFSLGAHVFLDRLITSIDLKSLSTCKVKILHIVKIWNNWPLILLVIWVRLTPHYNQPMNYDKNKN